MPRVHRAQPAVPLRGMGQVKVALLMQKDPFPILVVLLLGPGPLMVVALLRRQRGVGPILVVLLLGLGPTMVVALLWQGYNPGAILPGLP